MTAHTLTYRCSIVPTRKPISHRLAKAEIAADGKSIIAITSPRAPRAPRGPLGDVEQVPRLRFRITPLREVYLLQEGKEEPHLCGIQAQLA